MLQDAPSHLLTARCQGSKRSILVKSGYRRGGTARDDAGDADGGARSLAPGERGLVGIHKFCSSGSPRKRNALPTGQTDITPDLAVPIAKFVNVLKPDPRHVKTSSHSFRAWLACSRPLVSA